MAYKHRTYASVGEGRVDTVDMEFVSHMGWVDPFVPHDNEIGQEGTPEASQDRRNIKGDWIKGRSNKGGR